MNFQLHSRIRTGLAALGVIAGLCVPAAATPIGAAARMATIPAAERTVDVEQVRHRYRCRYGGCGRYWGDDWRYRHYRPYRGYGSGLYFGFGVPGFQYYAPSYRYYDPPRRYYRRAGSAHVAWCYDRYRSYREWDNTYQPYHGPRRQCWSPYS